MHMFYGGSGLGFLGMFIPMLIWLVIVVGIIYLVSRWFGGQSRWLNNESQNHGEGNSAIELLDKRYATGELTTEECRAMKKEIRGD